jgi:hypothetical protein
VLPSRVEQLLPERGVVSGEAVEAEGAEDELGDEDEDVVAGVGKAADNRLIQLARTGDLHEEVDR